MAYAKSRILLLLTLMLSTGICATAEVRLTAAMSNSLLLADRPHQAYLRIGLEGVGDAAVHARAPVNISLVLDRSTSMQGEKLEKAKRAAIVLLQHLGLDDIVSLVAYDSRASVLIPATRLTDSQSLGNIIRGIQCSGNTALYEGVLMGAAELRKFLDPSTVNRIVLLSDGQANVGPNTPEELGRLGTMLASEGISVTTIGVGLDYNEDLMTSTASHSDGNHLFAEKAQDILSAFNDELGDVTSVVAKNITVTADFDPRVRPVRALGRDVTIDGQHVHAGLISLCSSQTKYILLEVEVTPFPPNTGIHPASVHVEYADPINPAIRKLDIGTSLQFTKSEEDMRSSEDKSVMECVVAQLAVEKSEEAVRLRDQGQIQQSQQMLRQNAQWLQEQAEQYHSEGLHKQGQDTAQQAEQVVDDARWRGLRKSMSKGQYDVRQQTGKK